MPIGPAHTRKRSKNFFLLAVLGLLVAALYYMAMLKVGAQKP